LVERDVRGTPSSLTNVDPIDHFDIDGCNGETNFRMGGDDRIKFFTLLRGELL
jgi:hypothetical protein